MLQVIHTILSAFRQDCMLLYENKSGVEDNAFSKIKLAEGRSIF